MQEELRRYSAKLLETGNLPLEARVGVNTGEVVVRSIMTGGGHTEYTPIGHTTNLARECRRSRRPDRSLSAKIRANWSKDISQLEPLGPTKVKGVSELVNVYQVTGAGAAAHAAEWRAREDSRASSAATPTCRPSTPHWSRPARVTARSWASSPRRAPARAACASSFSNAAGRAGLTIAVGRAVAHGKDIPFMPMLEVFRNYYGITDADSDRAVREKIAGRLLLTDESFRDLLPVVFEFFGVPDPQHPVPRMDPEAKQRQLFAVLRKEMREGNVASQLVTLIEDLHWMDAGSEAFLEQWVDAIAGSRSLLLVTFRPEYHAAWTSKSYYRQIPLAPLGAEAVRELLADLLGATRASTAWQRRFTNAPAAIRSSPRKWSSR